MAGLKINPKTKQIVVFLFLLAAPADWTRSAAADGPLLRLEKSADAMGSTYSVELYGRDRVSLEAAADAAMDEARRLDDLLSNYKPDSEWSQVNRHAAERPMRISPELFQLLSACLKYSRESEGAFDISVGPLMKVWGFYKGTGHLPHRAEVAAALTKTGYGHVHLDPKAQTVWFDKPGVELDPGGIGRAMRSTAWWMCCGRKGSRLLLWQVRGAVFTEWARRRPNPEDGPSISRTRGTRARPPRRYF